MKNKDMLFFEDFKEGQAFKFVANETVHVKTWDGSETDRTIMTKNKVYNAVIEKDLGALVIKFISDTGNENYMSYDDADGKIDVLEQVELPESRKI